MEQTVKIKKLWIDNNKIFIFTENEQELWQSMLWYHRLLYATNEQRANYYTSFSGIHWSDVDEDISFESFFYDNPEPVGISIN